ncbi:hypothetical protein [Streptomyces olivoreticuli]|uniref:hypothetical protein n=1 Tax=Streptomyces olivoreticuli TaxID=68246 RepID=UPI000E271419|nr:hypothetical protein [Streptomyces olivoreticuli]
MRLLKWRMPRLRNLAVPLLGVLATLMLCGSVANAADSPRKEHKTFEVTGVGGLLPSPEIPKPGGKEAGTFFETYNNDGLYELDTEYGMLDTDDFVEIFADIFMSLTVTVGRAAVVCVQWAFKMTSLPGIEKAMTKAISASAGTVTETLLPSALVVGALVAWAGHRKSGSSLGQLGWVFASGVLAVSLLTTPNVWVSALDSTRTIGTAVAFKATDAGLGNGTQEPIELGHEARYTKDERDTMLRKSADAVWRTYVATPWCIAEFGSKEACKEYGKELLDQGPSAKKRKEWLSTNVNGNPDGGQDTLKWRQGHRPLGRMMVSFAALLGVALFAALAIMLAFASLASLLGALMLLVCGVFFACLWVIPGRPRQWGTKWFDLLLGFALQSFISTMVLGSAMIMTSVTTGTIGEYGYFAGAGLSICSVIAAFRMRRLMESIVGVSRAMGPGAAIGGLLTARGAMRGAGKIWRGARRLGRRIPSKPPMRWPAADDAGPGSAPGRVSYSPFPGGGGGGGGRGIAGSGMPRRPLPPPPSAQGARAPLPPGSGRGEVGPATSRPELPPASAPVRGRSVADGPGTGSPAPRRAIEAAPARPRPALPAGPNSLPPAQPAPAEVPAGRSSPTLRPEAGAPPAFGFQRLPRTGATAPRVIRGEVIRSAPVRPGGPTGPNPSRPEPARRRRRMSVPGARNGGGSR